MSTHVLGIGPMAPAVMGPGGCAGGLCAIGAAVDFAYIGRWQDCCYMRVYTVMA